MSYEMKLYAGRLQRSIVHEDKTWLEIIALIDLCSPGYDSAIANCKQNGVPAFFFAEDGDTKIVEDRYGAELQANKIEDIIVCLEKDVIKQPDYPRLKVALLLLQAIQQSYPEAKVILYGH
jgi:hypothetical protein